MGRRCEFNLVKFFLSTASFTNFFNLSLNQGINVLIALLITPYLFTNLGEENYGIINLALQIVTLLSVVVNYGFHLNGPKRLALTMEHSSDQSDIINEIISTRFYLAVLILVLLLIAIFFLNLFPNYSLVLAFSVTILLSEAIFPMFILQGFDRLALLSKANALGKLLYLGAIFLFIRKPEDNVWVNFLFGSTSLFVNLLLLIFIYKRWNLTFKFVFPARTIIRLRENFDFFISTIAGHASVHGGLIILSNFVDDFELGRFALAQRVAFLIRMIPVFITQSILQSATRYYTMDRLRYTTYLNKAYKLGLSLSFVIGVIFALGAPVIIRIVGGSYIDYSANILRILCFIPFFGMLNVSNMIKILVAEQKQLLAKATWTTAFLMIILSSFGSFYFGGYGLAFALLFTELINFLVHQVMLKRASRNER